MEGWTDAQKDRESTDRQMGRQTDGQTDRWAVRQTDRQTDRVAKIHKDLKING